MHLKGLSVPFPSSSFNVQHWSLQLHKIP